ncbi:exo 1,3/1,4-beta-D-glucan glucohydrolase [Croceicoccus sp. YJ47]|uniref:glycoside hydrolase family 3 protein n=1 Tax=Croceicoccus sp. YJ47 TaxID=2798724 RepID=UPI00192153C9|nr:exo 1,3/1,4-beta-D-glucan glucohydrolase [Croceicoccus sp. YJ47]QQN74169.1 exo 1,3/1,4-beta-D-glucan glucohydrolase [Croceicoccus sp. YJ47]
MAGTMAGALGAALAAAPLAAQPDPSAVADPSVWLALSAPIARDAAMEQRIEALIAAMSLEQKVGQIIQADIGSVTPEDVSRYHLGSILNGGNSTPGGAYNAPAPQWLKAADAFYAASMKRDGKLPRIPIIWGSDAVHGHNNIVGATLFPHNIGLGAARDPELLRRIGEITAVEMRVTGLDWTFAPTLAVVRDDRWGRTYEGFGETPEIATAYAAPLIEGLQGKIGDEDWLRGPHIIATAKHFLGDGGTTGGKDQGDTRITETGLRDLFSAPYLPAIEAGVQSVMVSFSGWNGAKMHGNRSLLTGVVKDRWNFDGFLVGDWNGHGQVVSCTATDCAQSVIAGLDMYMAPDSWKALYTSTLADARDGTLPMDRLDDAVRRILRVKLRAGLFEAGKPSSRPYAGEFERLGSADHRAVAREAVRKSLVLLKNAGGVLPLDSGANVLVTGDGADNLTKQTGGWTLTWQGTGTKRSDFPHAQSIWEGIADAATSAGGTATLSPDGSYATRPDVAIVVFGEEPYAEFQGDRPDVGYDDEANLSLLRSLRAKGIPTVSVFLSGRAMWANPFINASDAFVAAWLPGSEGGGIADVLFGKTEFTGKLPYSWPKSSDQTALNIGDADYDPLFPYGFGLTTVDDGALAMLPEDRASAAPVDDSVLFDAGRAGAGRRLLIGTPGALATNPGPDLITLERADRNAQEDSVRLRFTGKGRAAAAIVQNSPADLTRQTNGDLALELQFRVNSAPTEDVTLMMTCGEGCAGGFPLGAVLTKAAQGGAWTRLALPLSCFEKAGVDMGRIDAPLMLVTEGRLDLTLSSARIVSPSGNQVSCQ